MGKLLILFCLFRPYYRQRKLVEPAIFLDDVTKEPNISDGVKLRAQFAKLSPFQIGLQYYTVLEEMSLVPFYC